MREELLYRFFSGEASVPEENEVLDWLDADPANRRELIARRRLYDAVLMHAQPASRKPRVTVLPRWVRETVKYAAVVAVAAVMGAGIVRRMYDRAVQADNTITVPAGQCVDVVLPDGTKVCLNALSELKYPAFFPGGKRRVQLDGEAFFEVAREDGHPFVVETYACDVEVLGTKFDVEARSASDVFETALVEGCVRIDARDASGDRIELRPNQSLRRVGGRMVRGEIDSSERFLWREGLIAFRDASFGDLLREFEKYFGVKFIVRNAPATDTSFTGKIRMAEGVDHALWVLGRSIDFNYRRSDAHDVIYIQ